MPGLVWVFTVCVWHITVFSVISYHTYSKYSDRQVQANSVDPDQMLQNASAGSDQGLHYLPLIQQFLDILSGSKMDVQNLGHIW